MDKFNTLLYILIFYRHLTYTFLYSVCTTCIEISLTSVEIVSFLTDLLTAQMLCVIVLCNLDLTLTIHGLFVKTLNYGDYKKEIVPYFLLGRVGFCCNYIWPII